MTKKNDSRTIDGEAREVSDSNDTSIPIAEQTDAKGKPVGTLRGLVASVFGGDLSNFTTRLLEKSAAKVADARSTRAQAEARYRDEIANYVEADERAQKAVERHRMMPKIIKGEREVIEKRVASEIEQAEHEINQQQHQIETETHQRAVDVARMQKEKKELRKEKQIAKETEELEELERQAEYAKRRATAEAAIKKYENGISDNQADILADIDKREEVRITETMRNADGKSEDELAEEIARIKDDAEEERRAALKG